MTVLLAWDNVPSGSHGGGTCLLSSNLPVYIFLGGVAISQKFKTPLKRQKHEIQLARYTIYWANVWGKVRLVRQY